MNSKYVSPHEAYVWIWLPEETKPIVAGRLYQQAAGQIDFIYGQSYLARENAIAISEMELPLKPGPQTPPMGLQIAGAIRDAAPDAWGRRVILNRRFGREAMTETNFDSLNELDYLLESGSDRIGALDFQLSASEYEPRLNSSATLEELLTSTERVDRGQALTPELARALQHGTSIGGARPKALIHSEQKKYIAKFSSSSDTYDVVKAEFVAMRLAKLVGLDVAAVEMTRALGKDVLLIERFDRALQTNGGYSRKNLISALTLLELNEMFAHHASYKDLCDIIRQKFEFHDQALREMFGRLIFNVMVSNNDDHARNHAAIWNGRKLRLSPAYDICPQRRFGWESNQALYIFEDDRTSRLHNCLNACTYFQLNRSQAFEMVENIMFSLVAKFDEVCNEAAMSEIDRNLMRSTQVLHDYAFDGLPPSEREALLGIKARFRKID